MGKHQTSIEINGKLYDARSGKLIAGSSGHSDKIHQPKSTVPKTMDIAPPRKAGVPNPHSNIERSKTLMRHAVKKPAAQTKTTAKATQAAAPATATKVFSDFMKPNMMKHRADIDREKRAAQIHQSKLVKKFSDMSLPDDKTSPQPQVHALPVKPAPVDTLKKEASGSNKANSVIEEGLRKATSHQSKFKSPAKKLRSKRAKRTRLASIGAGSLAALLLMGFFVYQNIPNISMRYAATRAGIRASLPNYRPAGFALSNHIEYTPGQITLEYKSNSDDRRFNIIQRESAWNSDTLRQSYVASTGDQVHIYEDKGQTIFLYDDHNATWVNGGVWYEIKGDSQLNTDQLIRIVTSM